MFPGIGRVSAFGGEGVLSQQINLFNPIFLSQKKYFSAATIVQALGLVILGALAFYGYAAYQFRLLDKDLGDASRRLEQEQARFSRTATEFAPKQKNKMLEVEIQKLEKQVEDREAILSMQQSGTLNGVRELTEFMRAFARQSVNGLWLTSFSMNEAGSGMVIGGRALRADMVPAYIRRLGQERVMQGHSFGGFEVRLSQIDAQRNYFEFSLRAGGISKAEHSAEDKP